MTNSRSRFCHPGASYRSFLWLPFPWIFHPYKDQKITQIAHFKWFLQRLKLMGQKEVFTREKSCLA